MRTICIKKTHKWLLAILSFACILFISTGLCLNFAKADTADVYFTNVASYDDLTKGSDTVAGETVDTYGCTGWGGMLKYITFGQVYDTSAIKNSGNGAFAFDLYIADATALAAYKEVNVFNLDVCAETSYADTNKYTFTLGNNTAVLNQLDVGWNRIIAPLSVASEKNGTGATSVGSIRINQNGSNIEAGENNVSFANFRFTTTSATTWEVSPIRAEQDDVYFTNVSSYADLTKGSATLFGETVDTYGCTGWGGMLKHIIFGEAYDTSAIKGNGNGAFAFDFYIADATALSKYQSVDVFNLDVCADTSYNDTNKYSFTLGKNTAVLNQLSVGWNRIIAPLSVASEKNGTGASSVGSIRINQHGSNITSGNSVSFANFRFTTTSATTWVVSPVTVCSTASGAHVESFDNGWKGASYTSTATEVKEGASGIKITGSSTETVASKVLTTAKDVSAYGALTLWINVSDASAVDGSIKITSAGATSATDNYAWDFAGMNLVNGWNQVSLPLTDAYKTGAPELKAIDYIEISMTSSAGATMIFDDMHANKTGSVVIESFDNGIGGLTEVVPGISGNATGGVNEGWIERNTIPSVNISGMDKIAMWILADATAAGIISGTEIELTSSGQADNNELTLYLPSGIVEGWNYITWDIASCKNNGADLTNINFLGIVKPGLARNSVYFDCIYAYDSVAYVCDIHGDIDANGKCDICDVEVSHYDADNNCKCDYCNADMDHVDADSNGKCDVCDVEVSHYDADANGKCDYCDTEISHYDADANGKCDWCDTEVSHYDADNNCKCDYCDANIPHKDTDANGKCDVCGIETSHYDADANGKCDWCDTEISHYDADNNCKCDYCNESIAHKDTDANGKCDVCGVELSHYDADSNGKCDWCDTELSHYDANNDCKCDYCNTDIAHVDADSNCKCDVCGTDYTHVDADSNCKCDVCGTDIAHVDADSNCKCDVCDTDIAHVNDDGDKVCDVCGTKVKDGCSSNLVGNSVIVTLAILCVVAFVLIKRKADARK